jgi:hypothetical protein
MTVGSIYQLSVISYGSSELSIRYDGKLKLL